MNPGVSAKVINTSVCTSIQLFDSRGLARSHLPSREMHSLKQDELAASALSRCAAKHAKKIHLHLNRPNRAL